MNNSEERAGLGIRCILSSKTTVAGNEEWMRQNNCFMQEEVLQSCKELQDMGKTIILFGQEGQVQGMIAVADTPRPESYKVVQELERSGHEVWMVTGDNIKTAEAVAGQIGIKNIFAGVLPHQKSEKVI